MTCLHRNLTRTATHLPGPTSSHKVSSNYAKKRTAYCFATPPRCQERARLHCRDSTRLCAGPSDVFVLDFDGVVVDSEPEVSTSAYGAAAAFWPDVFNSVTPEQQQTIMTGMRTVRPVLVRGYEALVMARTLKEDPSCADAILSDWESVLQSKLEEWGERPKLLINFFEGYRQGLQIKDSEDWIRRQALYPGVAAALQQCPFPFYVATSKAAHRVTRLCQALLALELPPDSPRLFAGLLPPNEKKIEALRTVAAKPLVADTGATLHFVDDRFETVAAVRADPELKSLRVYFANWGYSTAAEKRAARALLGVTVISLPQFCELLTWGIVMGVDDGCEPTEEEVLQGVAR